VTVIRAEELSEDLAQQWRNVQATNPALAGPCFRPELFAAVGRFRPDVRVAVLEDDRQSVAGFLPFLLDGRWPVAKPVPLCDYQAIIGPASHRWDARRAIWSAGLKAWDFDHLVGVETLATPPSFCRPADAPRVQLAEGTEAYLSSLGSHGKSLKAIASSKRYLERDVGPTRFVPMCNDTSVFHQVLRWKAERFNEGRALDGWLVGALESLYRQTGPDFFGALSALYAGDHLVAAHFGLRCQGVLFYWFPAFNFDFSRYSPGRLLLYHLLAGLDAFGCHTLDFGPGGESYKRSFSNQALQIVAGSFEVASVFSLARNCKRRLITGIRSNRWLRGGARTVLRTLRGIGRR
jgi:CelD/BcsL family acetyltransferase involved in cellulose biosynthesis